MSTNSTIAVQKLDGTVQSVYCHWDGYIDGVGKTLINYYNSQRLAELVVSGGDISYLRKEFSPSTSTVHNFDNPQKDVTVLYHRDRGEKFSIGNYWDVKMFKLSNTKQEYNYLWVDGEWNVSFNNSGIFNPVKNYVSVEQVKQPDIKEKNVWEEKYNLLVHEIYHEHTTAKMLFDEAIKKGMFSNTIVDIQGYLRCAANVLDIISKIEKSYPNKIDIDKA